MRCITAFLFKRYYSDGESKGVDERRECSQLKRRRMLQYNSSDTDVSISDELLASEFMKSNIREDSLMKDETNDNLQWILGLSERCNVPRQMKTLKLPVTISITPCNKLRGSRTYLSTPPKLASSVAYPFALIKPCGRIHAPFLLKQEESMGEDPSQCYPTSAFSGKPVVVKTKIRTEGGKGSITIMRTKG
ncbi:unnamed protein product [Spirodela intermedia]|uniref:Uncharacterized protein n=1 Tax=Spirodela intermedia TaxID=51605 RepID=A0A7I8J1J0_SPIIN|nr:unnamed protein product [Spirodela intermedia]CAA6664086.1 unnamed protein product [Spirodela intermedia]